MDFLFLSYFLDCLFAALFSASCVVFFWFLVFLLCCFCRLLPIGLWAIAHLFNLNALQYDLFLSLFAFLSGSHVCFSCFVFRFSFKKNKQTGLCRVAFSGLVVFSRQVWAIGTGLTATPADAQGVHAYVRSLLAAKYGDAVADGVRIQYGEKEREREGRVRGRFALKFSVKDVPYWMGWDGGDSVGVVKGWMAWWW